MGAPERAPGRITDKLEKYIDLVGNGAGPGGEAKALRRELESDLKGDPLLHSADLEMQRRELMEKLGGKKE